MSAAGLITTLLFAPPPQEASPLVPRFEEVSGTGVDFRHAHGGTGEKALVETMGAGLALFDADLDGDLDLYLVQSGPLPPARGDARDRLYRNEGGWRFVEATGLPDDAAYGMGACAGDYDGDGDEDLWVGSYGEDLLRRNLGGAFEDVAPRARVRNPAWASSAAFADLDLDGDLDLFVSNYLDYAIERNPWCGNRASGYRTYCHPDAFAGADDLLLRNEGDGTFTEAGRQAGLAPASRTEGKGLGVVCADLDLDGDPEIYVANDSTANFLYRNDGAMRFAEVGARSGVAFNEQGRSEAGMGTDAGDADGDGRLDLFVTNLDDETNTLYRNEGGLSFADATAEAGLARPSLTKLGFATFFLDAEGDGDADLFVGNGHLLDNVALYKDSTSYAQRSQLFANDGRGRFREVAAGPALEVPRVARAGACGDLDGDADPDLAVTTSNGPPLLLRNAGGDGAGWIQVVLRGRRSNRLAVGALVRVATPRGAQVAEVRRGNSYQSSGDPRLSFGLGGEAAASVEVRWPSGRAGRAEGVPRSSRVEWVEGEAAPTLRPLSTR